MNATQKTAFIAAIAPVLFNGRVSKSQYEGMVLILDYYTAHYAFEPNYVAYVLASAMHESGSTFQPVREGFGKTAQESIAAVTKLYLKGRIKTNYALPNKQGRSYFGRGLVQITWLANYSRIGKLIGVDLETNPDLALDPNVSVKILVEGMVHGWFTGAKLSNYVTAQAYNYEQARRIVNGMDKAEPIAVLAEAFRTALITATSLPTAPSSKVGQAASAKQPHALSGLGLPGVD